MEVGGAVVDGVLEGVEEHGGLAARPSDDQGELIALALQGEQKPPQLLVGMQEILVDKVGAIVGRGEFLELFGWKQFGEHADEGVVVGDKIGGHGAAVDAEHGRLVQENLPFGGVMFNAGGQKIVKPGFHSSGSFCIWGFDGGK